MQTKKKENRQKTESKTKSCATACYKEMYLFLLNKKKKNKHIFFRLRLVKTC